MTAPDTRRRGLTTVAYTAATALGGLSALMVAGGALMSPDPGVLDVLLWSALAVLLFAAAVHEWWFKGRKAERSRQLATELGPAEVEQAARSATGEVDTIRRLRLAHPTLSLQDAYQLVKQHGQRTG